MSPFEFFFSLFGLVLGLAVAVVIGGFSDVLRERKPVPLGWLTPMLAAFVLIDLTSMWVNAWAGMSEITVAYGPFITATLVAAIYFFAASMVFPKDVNDWPSLDDYYRGHHRYVLGGVAAANLGVMTLEAVSGGGWRGFVQTFYQTELTAIWWIVLIILCVVPHRRVQLAGLAALLLMAVYAMIVFW